MKPVKSYDNKGVGAVRGMFMFVLLAAFALLSVIVVLTGAKVYKAVETRGAENYRVRTTLSYIAGKVRAQDAAERIYAEAVEGGDRLVLTAEYGGEEYATYIYASGGMLMEYFGRADAAFEPAFGEAISEAAEFSASMQDGLLTVSVTQTDGRESSLTLYVQSGGEGA